MTEEVGKKMAKRDALVENERRMQEFWRKERVFEADAPAPGQHLKH